MEVVKIKYKTMKHILKLTSLLMIMLLVAFTSCKDDDPLPVNNDFTVLTEYLGSNSMDLTDVLSGWIVGAPALEDVGDFVGANYIIDIRAAVDFAGGHMEGAVNTTLANILTEAENAGGKPIVVACYTGQSAGHAVMALRLSGYADAKVLKFGMSGWNPDFSGPWNGNSGDVNGIAAVGHANWNFDATAVPAKMEAPSWTATATTPAEILKERVTFMLEGGFKGA